MVNQANEIFKIKRNQQNVATKKTKKQNRLNKCWNEKGNKICFPFNYSSFALKEDNSFRFSTKHTTKHFGTEQSTTFHRDRANMEWEKRKQLTLRKNYMYPEVDHVNAWPNLYTVARNKSPKARVIFVVISWIAGPIFSSQFKISLRPLQVSEQVSFYIIFTHYIFVHH